MIQRLKVDMTLYDGIGRLLLIEYALMALVSLMDGKNSFTILYWASVTFMQIGIIGGLK